jgi:ribonuclease HI
VLPDLILPWKLYEDEIGTEIVGDNEVVIDWVNGQAAASTKNQKRSIEVLIMQIYSAWRDGLIAPRVPSADWCRHVYRERNVAADKLANKGNG